MSEAQIPEMERQLTAMRALVAPVAGRLAADGHRLFLVGGVVRDLHLLGSNDVEHPDLLHDVDLTTDARPPAIKAALEPDAEALWTQGERFGTIAAHVAGHSVEITTHRAEAYDPESRKPVVTFGEDLRTDLSRRDFTINAMAIDVVDGALYDPFGGRSDLDGRVLRTPLDPEISFNDDPLRMLRAARFIARFDLVVDPAVIEAATNLAARIDIVSRERVQDELERLLGVDEPRRGLDFLVETGLLEHVAPGVFGGGVADADAVTDADINRVVARVCATEGSTARRAALVWEIGIDAAAVWLRELRYSTQLRQETVRFMRGVEMILAATTTAPEATATAGAVDSRAVLRRLAAAVGAEATTGVLSLAGLVGDGPLDEMHRTLRDLERNEDLNDLSIPLSGQQIMELLDLAPGPIVGEATNHLREKRLDRGPLTADEAAAMLRSWWSDRNA